MSLIVSKDYYQLFQKQSHSFLQACIMQLDDLNLKENVHHKTFISILNVLTMFTDHKLWKCYKTENSNTKSLLVRLILFDFYSLLFNKDQLLERTLSEFGKSYLKSMKVNELFQRINVTFFQE